MFQPSFWWFIGFLLPSTVQYVVKKDPIHQIPTIFRENPQLFNTSYLVNIYTICLLYTTQTTLYVYIYIYALYIYDTHTYIYILYVHTIIYIYTYYIYIYTLYTYYIYTQYIHTMYIYIYYIYILNKYTYIYINTHYIKIHTTIDIYIYVHILIQYGTSIPSVSVEPKRPTRTCEVVMVLSACAANRSWGGHWFRERLLDNRCGLATNGTSNKNIQNIYLILHKYIYI